jgi:hypothetical protein
MSQELKLPDGSVIRLGNLVPDKMPLSFVEYPAAEMLEFSDVMTILKNPKRKKRRELFTWILNQGGRSSCNPYAATGAFRKRRVLDGRTDIELAPEYMYAGINGGNDSGSMLDSGMLWMCEKGIPPRDMVAYEEYKMKNISMEAARKAMEFRAHECYQIQHGDLRKYWQAVCSALARSDMLVFAVHVGNDYMKLDGRKCAGVDKGLGNHAVHADDLIWDHGPKGFEDLFLDQAGSWGKRVHDNGRAGITIKHLEGTYKIHATYAVRSTTADSQSLSPTLR